MSKYGWVAALPYIFLVIATFSMLMVPQLIRRILDAVTNGATIRNADMLLVLDQGEIIERGRHEDLLKRKGFYYNLYMSQFRKEQPEELARLFDKDGNRKVPQSSPA